MYPPRVSSSFQAGTPTFLTWAKCRSPRGARARESFAWPTMQGARQASRYFGSPIGHRCGPSQIPWPTRRLPHARTTQQMPAQR
eukprot:3693304-Pyramimonas_sp.AAC.1